MISIGMKSKTNPDGTLDLHVPTGILDSEVEVVVVVQSPVPNTPHGWPEGFFERVIGSIEDPTFVRHAQCLCESDGAAR